MFTYVDFQQGICSLNIVGNIILKLRRSRICSAVVLSKRT